MDWSLDEMKMIDVAMTAWPNHPVRLANFLTTVWGLQKHLKASRHEIKYRVSVETDSCPRYGYYASEFGSICKTHGIKIDFHGPPSLGGNMNSAFQFAESDCIFFCQDDWLLCEDIDISDAADWLESHEDFVMYRYDVSSFKFLGMVDGAVEIDKDSTYPYGDNPGMWHRRFFDKLGWYEEDGRFGSSEVDMNKRAKASDVRIAAHAPLRPPCPQRPFKHIGEVSSVLDEWRNRAVSR